MAETVTHKICLKCKEYLPISNFYFRKETGQYRGCCKKCKSFNTKEDIASRLLSGIKVCKHCNIKKPTSEYQKAGGGKWLQPYCKPCDAERKRKYIELNRDNVLKKKKEYYIQNKESILEKQNRYISENIDKIKEKRKEYRNKNSHKIKENSREYIKKYGEIINKKQREKRALNAEFYRKKWAKKRAERTPAEIERKKSNDREWRKKNIDKIKAYRNSDEAKEKRKIYNRLHSRKKNATDISYRIVKNIRSRIGFALKRNIKKSETTKSLLGCSVEYFKKYFQDRFTDNMTWDDFMNGDIHIDHIKPCKEFNLTIPEEQKKCFHYTNLQPLWWYDNLKKGAKYQELKTA